MSESAPHSYETPTTISAYEAMPLAYRREHPEVATHILAENARQDEANGLLRWTRSSFTSGHGLEIAALSGGGVVLRNSNAPDERVYYGPIEWKLFSEGMTTGEFGFLIDGSDPRDSASAPSDVPYEASAPSVGETALGDIAPKALPADVTPPGSDG